MDNKEEMWKHIMGAKTCMAIYSAMESMFKTFKVETNYDGEILDLENIVKTPAGERLEITKEIEIPYLYEKEDANSILGNYDKTNDTALLFSRDVVGKIAIDITANPLKNFAGNIAYHNGKFVFAYGYLLAEVDP